jgi:hypothetical protein
MPLRQPPHERERTGLDQEVLGMLALSAVVRPSHIGLRYATPLLTSEDESGAFLHKPTAGRSSNRLQRFFELTSRLSKKHRLLSLRSSP